MHLPQAWKQAYIDGFRSAMSVNHHNTYLKKFESTENPFYLNASVKVAIEGQFILDRYWLRWPPSKEMFLAPVFLMGMKEADRRYNRRNQRKELSDEV